MLKIAVLVSGGGTNLQAIIDSIENGAITNAEISVVISNNAGAYALERARKHGIEAVSISPKNFADREEFNRALLEKIEGVLARGVKVTGATVHFVDDGTDTGPIILQKPVEVREDDTPKSLQQRVMEEAEWVIMPRAIDLIANGRVRVEDGKVKIL